MPIANPDLDLTERLNAALAGTGFFVRPGEQGCVLVERMGFLRGIWHCNGGAYSWFPGGYSEPTHVFEDPGAVIAFMLRKTV